MNKLKDVYVKPMRNSKFIEPLSMKFKQDGKEKRRDIMVNPDRVNILLYNISRKVLIFIKQFRPVIYINNIPEEDLNKPIDVEKHPIDDGITIEVCGGIVTNGLSLEEIAVKNVLKKCSYKIAKSQLQTVIKYPSGVGITAKVQTLFYCEVMDNMRICNNVEADDDVEIIEMNIPEVREYIARDHVLSPSNFLFAIYWFLCNKYT